MYRVINLLDGPIILKDRTVIPTRNSYLGYWWIDTDTMTTELSGLQERHRVDIIAWGPSGGGPAVMDATVVFGEDVARGEAVYLDPVTNKAYKAIANDDIKMRVYGLVYESCAADIMGKVVTTGLLMGIVGASPNQIYYLSETVPGAFSSIPPTALGSWIVQVAVGKAATAVNVQINLHAAVQIEHT